MSSRYEEMLQALLNGDTVNFEPRSRMEQYLKNCCDQCGCNGLPEPRTRAEMLLYQLAEKLAGGGGSGGGQNVPVYDGTPLSDAVSFDATDTKYVFGFSVGSSFLVKDTIYFELPRELFGNAKPSDVKSDVRFTSSYGVDTVGEHVCESGGDAIFPCIIELFDQDYCGPYNVTYKAYENGSIVDRTAVVPTGDTINIVTIRGTEMFVSGAFSDIRFYDADGTRIESTSRFADGGIYYTIPAFAYCNVTIFG